MSASAAVPVVSIERRPGVVIVRVDGVIDDNFKSAAFDDVPRDAPVIFDLDKVARITSFGVREWSRALRHVSAPAYYFARCRPIIVAQFNSVARFGGDGKLASFYCPYVCPDCDESFDQLLDVRKDAAAVESQSAPAARCPSCDVEAEFDDLEASYFATAAQQPQLQLQSAVAAALDSLDVTMDAVDEPLHVEKSISDELTVLRISGGLDKRARIKRYAQGVTGQLVVDLQGATLASAEGIDRLRELLEVSEADTYLAGVPLVLAISLLGFPPTVAFSLISVTHAAHCRSCGLRQAVDVTGWTQPSTVSFVCTRCGAEAVEVRWTDADAARLARVTLAEPPTRVAAYLSADDDFAEDTVEVLAGHPGAAVDIKPGAKLLGKYEVLHRIGFGGMAEVLLGRQLGVEGFEKKVVIKRILPHLSAQPSFVQMFVQEARIAARLDHSNIAQIYGLERMGDDYFMIMEYVRGLDLSDVVKLSRTLGEPIPVSLACRIVANVCAALHAAHTWVDDDGNERPILHRDVSPHNVLVGFDGGVKLTDFGVAKAADSVDRTETGTLKGKIIYMSPELVGGEPPSPQSDVFAAGLVLYVCLTWQNPFQRATETASLTAVLACDVPPVSTYRNAVADEVCEILARALASDPGQRYSSAASMESALERCLTTLNTPATNAELSRWLAHLVERGREGGFVTQTGSVRVPSPSAVDEAMTMTTPEKVVLDGVPLSAAALKLRSGE